MYCIFQITRSYIISVLGSFFYPTQQASFASTADVHKTTFSPAPAPAPFQEPEPFVPPDELEIPQGMEIVSLRVGTVH